MLLPWTCLALLASSLGLAAAQDSANPEVKSIPVCLCFFGSIGEVNIADSSTAPHPQLATGMLAPPIHHNADTRSSGKNRNTMNKLADPIDLVLKRTALLGFGHAEPLVRLWR